MVPDRIQVGMGEGAVTRAPHIVSSEGLGSCLAVALYDARGKIGGLAHIMLPDSLCLNGRNASPYQCADMAIATLLEGMRNMAARQEDIVARLAGGAQMFSLNDDVKSSIGEQNILSVKQLLKSQGIPLVGENTGGQYGRSVEFRLDSGKLIVRVIGREDQEI